MPIGSAIGSAIGSTMLSPINGGGVITAPIKVLVFGDSILGAASTNFTDSGTSFGITGITRANPAVVSETNSNLSATSGDIVYIHSNSGMTQINDAEYNVTAGTSSSATLSLNSSAYSAWTSGGKIYKRNGADIYNYVNGIIGFVNALTGQRYQWYHDRNRAIGGNSITEMNARKEACLNPIDFDLAVVMGGTNDVGTTSGATPASLSTMTTQMTAIIQYITVTLGKTMVLGTVPPVDDNTATQKQRRLDYNAWVRTQASNKVIIWDYYDTIASGDNWISTYAYDGVHPAGPGGWWMAKDMVEVLNPIYGTGSFTLNSNNLVTNPYLTGTGGSISGTAITNNGIASGWTANSSGTSVATTRTVSKDSDDKQVLTCNFGSGLSTAERLSIQQTIAGSAVTDNKYVVAEALVQVTAGTGMWYELCLRLQNQSGVRGIDLSRRATTEALQLSSIISTNSGILHLKTQPIMKLSTWTSIIPRIDMTFNCSSEAGSGSMKVLACEVYPVDTARG